MPEPTKTKFFRIYRATAARDEPVTLPTIESALDALVDGVGAERAILAAPDELAPLEVLAARRPGCERIPAGERYVSFTLFAFARKQSAAAVISPIMMHPIFANAPSFTSNTRSALAAPLFANGKLIAVVMLHEARRKTIFDAAERDALELFREPLAKLVAAYLGGRPESATKRVTEPHNGTWIVGDSPVMRALVAKIKKLAPSPSTLLITGELGTGKQCVADAVHTRSRHGKPYKIVNCASLTASSADAELFGSAKNAFTGVGEQPGLFLAAEDGTLFLDEVGELSLDVQGKLLTALQLKEVRPVGGTKAKKFRARVIAATNRDLDALVREKKFRADLRDRLNPLEIAVPPLRERLDDLPGLVDFLVRRIAGEELKPVPVLAADVLPALGASPWPGNVRELENVLRKGILLVEGTIHARDLEIPGAPPPKKKRERARLRAFKESEIKAAIEAAKGSQRAAARMLNVPKSSLQRWVKDREQS